MKREWWGGMQGGPWAAFAMGRRGRAFEFGEIRLAILSLLDEGPKHGYQIMKEMGERFGGLYSCSAGSVYPTLQQLEDEDLVTSKREEGKRVYHITAAGREELERDPDAVDRIWDRARNWEDWSQFMGPQVVVLMTPLVGTLKAAMRAASRAAGRSDREAHIRTILERATKELENLEKSWRK